MKKALALTVVVSIILGMGVMGTLAYFTDTDSATNVMTVGSVDITQNEKDADGKDFEQGQRLMPGENNGIDKIVNVTNVGKSDAYIRTLFAFELADVNGDGEVTKDDFNLTVGYETGEDENADPISFEEHGVVENINGRAYMIFSYTYSSPLAPKVTSHDSLTKVFLKDAVTQEQAQALFGKDGKYTVLVMTQAAQKDGFTSADNALNTSFGEPTLDESGTLKQWFGDIAPEDTDADVDVPVVPPSEGGENEPPETPSDNMIYFNNTDNWEEVYIFLYGSGNNGWPGELMTQIGDTSYYKYELPENNEYVRVIFISNGNGPQTLDSTIPTDGKNMYSYDTGEWSVYTPSVSVVETIVTSAEQLQNAVKESGKIKLDNTITTNSLTITESVTINLNGNTLSVENGIEVTGGEVEIEGGTIEGAVSASGSGYIYISDGSIGAVSASNGGQVYIFDGTIGAVSANGNGYVDISGGTMVEGNVSANGNGGIVNIGGGTITGNVTASNGGRVYITGGSIVTGNVTAIESIVTIEGGTITGDVSVSGGTVEIKGGTITGDINANGGRVTITGGSITGAINNTGGRVTISGGTFSSDPSDYVADGYEATQNDGTWTVVKEEPPEIDRMTIYFQNNWLWTDVCLHYWDSSTGDTEWPGKAMEFYENDGRYDIYKYEIPADVTGFVINGIRDDGSGSSDQTPDITEGFYDGICYYMTWNNGNQVGSGNIDDILPPDPTNP